MSASRLAGPFAERAERLAARLDERGLSGARVALVLGSGLGAFAERLEDAVAVGFDELDEIPSSAVPGHAGRFVRGTLHGVPVLVQQGRVHLYEGHSPFVVTLPVRALARLGVGSLILTNAAGGLVPDWPVPCLMRLTDHLNFQHRTPLARAEAGRACVYDEGVAECLEEGARETGVELRAGVYAGLLGPTYETPSEIRMLQRAGAHAVGMSTVLEALAAHADGLRVGAISCISNPGAGIAAGKLNHEEVVEAGRQIADDFGRLLEAAVRAIGVRDQG